MLKIFTLIIIFFIILITGCITVGPDYVPPDTPSPAAWNADLENGLSAKKVKPDIMESWWATFDDPVLSILIKKGIAENLDLKKARAQLYEARARRGMAKAELFPALKTTGSASRRRSSEESGRGATSELYTSGFDASWEIDIFGGKQRAIEAAEAKLQASHEDLRDVMVSMTAEVAINYVELRSLQARLSIAKANLDKQKSSLDITLWRNKAGLTTMLDVEQAIYNMEQTRSRIPDLETGLKKAKNRIEVLLGLHSGDLDNILTETKAIPVSPLEVAIGVPADILRRRPDVRRDERILAAQTANIGVASADRFPKFFLPGSIGLEALTPGGLFSSGARISSIAANISWTIFDAGRIRQNIQVQNAKQKQALIQYEATVLTALEEVENALVAYAKEHIRSQSLLEASLAAQRAVEIVSCQYTSGRVDFQILLDTQRTSLSLQDQLAESKGTTTSNLIRLYKALGGGWTPVKPLK